MYPGAGTVYGIGNYDNARAQMCPGATYGSIINQGSTSSRLGIGGEPGYFNTGSASPFCAPPVAPNSVGSPTLFGDSGVGVVLGPGNFNWDIALVKTTHITERQTVIFRTEFFNAFNHPQFSNPVVWRGCAHVRANHDYLREPAHHAVWSEVYFLEEKILQRFSGVLSSARRQERPFYFPAPQCEFDCIYAALTLTSRAG